MKFADKTERLIGSTPLVDLTTLANGNATILGKYEATNPGGSVKGRRVAKYMLDAAEKDGSLQPGGTVIEPTSGNTGVGLAMLAAERGYKMVLVMLRPCRSSAAARRGLWCRESCSPPARKG